MAIGIGAFHFNPERRIYFRRVTKTWVELKPFRLEGQGMAEYPDRKPYNLTQMMIPMGGGF